MSHEPGFMTPAQQRAYLAELRHANQEIYKLTGARSQLTDERPDGLGNGMERLSLTSAEQRKPAPPVPAKSTALRTGGDQIARSSPGLQSSTFSAGERPPIPQKPRALPQPPITASGARQADINRGQARKLPSVPTSQQSPHEPIESPVKKKVPITLTNYAIPQFSTLPAEDVHVREHDEHPRTANGTSVSIPTFSFPEQNYHSTSSSEFDRNRGTTATPTIALHEVEHPVKTPDPSVPSFSFTGPDDTAESTAVPSLSVTVDDASSPKHDRGDHIVDGSRMVIPGRERQHRRRGHIPKVQKDLVDRGLNCANCYEPLGRGRVITANHKRYHPSHFTCFECAVPLEHVEFYVHKPEYGLHQEEQEMIESEVYCHFDYHELFTPRCYVCTTPVVRDGIKALGRVFHADHFFCALCSKTFECDDQGGAEFVERDNLAWHPKCYEEKFSVSYMCRKCKGRIIAGEQVITMGTGSHFHGRCFQCAKCKASLEDGFYWSEAKEGICKPCKDIEVKQGL